MSREVRVPAGKPSEDTSSKPPTADEAKTTDNTSQKGKEKAGQAENAAQGAEKEKEKDSEEKAKKGKEKEGGKPAKARKEDRAPEESSSDEVNTTLSLPPLLFPLTPASDSPY